MLRRGGKVPRSLGRWAARVSWGGGGRSERWRESQSSESKVFELGVGSFGPAIDRRLNVEAWVCKILVECRGHLLPILRSNPCWARRPKRSGAVGWETRWLVSVPFAVLL